VWLQQCHRGQQEGAVHQPLRYERCAGRCRCSCRPPKHLWLLRRHQWFTPTRGAPAPSFRCECVVLMPYGLGACCEPVLGLAGCTAAAFRVQYCVLCNQPQGIECFANT
jgi:hypothetical protein